MYTNSEDICKCVNWKRNASHFVVLYLSAINSGERSLLILCTEAGIDGQPAIHTKGIKDMKLMV